MQLLGPITDTKLRPSPTTLAIAVIVWAAADAVTLVSDSSFLTAGPADETAHVLTTLLVIWALGRRVCRRFLVPALIASIVIDIDHIPGRLGLHWLEAGVRRPYTHSLLTIAVLLAGAGLWRRRRDVLLGIALGIAIHFWRDLAEPGSGVALLWPFSGHSFSVSHAGYLLVLIGVIAVDAHRARGARRAAPRESVAATQ